MVNIKENNRIISKEREKDKRKEGKRHRVYGGGYLISEGHRLKHLWVSQSQVNDCICWGWLKKIGGPKILYAWVELGEADVCPSNTRWKGGNDSFIGVDRYDEVKPWDSTQESKLQRCKETKVYEPYFWGWTPKGVLHTESNLAY